MPTSYSMIPPAVAWPELSTPAHSAMAVSVRCRRGSGMRVAIMEAPFISLS
ncbi:MAG: hypothetical protein ACREVR_07930 [Burkholderiales bacterium]